MRSTCAPALLTLRSTAALVIASSLACSDTTSTPPAVLLSFAVMPSALVAGVRVTPAIQVTLVDASGHVATHATNTVTLAIDANSAGGRLIGTVSVAAIDGVATFPDISIDKTAKDYTLSATSPGLTTAKSAVFEVVAGSPARLGFLTQPTQSIANTPIAPFKVALQDAYQNTVPTDGVLVSLTIANNPGSGDLGGIIAVETVQGVATFPQVTITRPGVGYVLRAGVGNNQVASAQSAAFNMVFGSATRLTFTTQPATSIPGEAMFPAVVVGITDAGGNVIVTANDPVTISIGANAANASLTGTRTTNAVAGVARFADLAVDKPAQGLLLTADAAGLASATSVPFTVRSSISFAGIAAGYFHSCGVDVSGAAQCWGQNQGQVGDGTLVARIAPVQVSGTYKFTSISSGRTHSCGIDDTSHALCWGTNDFGELGKGTTGAALVPAPVAGSVTFTSISAGYAHTCAIGTDGLGYCWGDNSSGALGNGTNVAATIPTPTTGGIQFTSISAGRYFSCGVAVAHTGYCWGINATGSLGDGSKSTRFQPAPVQGQLQFATIGAGGFFACGLTISGAAYCWGDNTSGQLGVGNITSTTSPNAIAGGLVFTSLTVGNRHACGLTASGAAYCWGDNTDGELGNGSNSNGLVPVPVFGNLTFVSITAGRFHTCGVTTAGVGYCWGQNASWELGTPAVSASTVPVRVR